MIKGVTLIELIIILLLVGILAIVAVPRILTISGFRQETALNKIKADLKYVREFAINNSCRTRVTYDTSGNTSYTAEQYNKTTSNWEDMTDPTTRTSYFTVTLNTGNYTGVQITVVNFDGQNIVEFDSIGRPYNGSSSTLLSSDGTITLTGGRSITVTAETGRID